MIDTVASLLTDSRPRCEVQYKYSVKWLHFSLRITTGLRPITSFSPTVTIPLMSSPVGHLSGGATQSKDDESSRDGLWGRTFTSATRAAARAIAAQLPSVDSHWFWSSTGDAIVNPAALVVTIDLALAGRMPDLRIRCALPT